MIQAEANVAAVGPVLDEVVAPAIRRSKAGAKCIGSVVAVDQISHRGPYRASTPGQQEARSRAGEVVAHDRVGITRLAQQDRSGAAFRGRDQSLAAPGVVDLVSRQDIARGAPEVD